LGSDQHQPAAEEEDGLPLKDMKSDSFKEKAVTGVAGAGCKTIILYIVVLAS